MTLKESIQKALPDLPRKLKNVALFALDHPERLAMESMRAAAAMIGVTSTTMLRFAHRLGFESYDAFRTQLQQELLSHGFGARAAALRLEQGIEGRADAFRAAICNNIDQALHPELDGNLSAAAKAIRQARTCHIIGTGPMHWLCAIIETTGRMALSNLRLVGPETVAGDEAVAHILPSDCLVAIGINPYALRTIRAIQHAQTAGATTIAITDRPSSPLAIIANHKFICGTESPHYYPSMVGLLAVVEALLATVVAEGDKQELHRVRTIEGLRTTSDTYQAHQSTLPHHSDDTKNERGNLSDLSAKHNNHQESLPE